MAAPLSRLSSHERTRVEDYLNDKIQVSADFGNLDSLLSSLRAQHELQQRQVRPSAQFPASGIDTRLQLAEANEALSNATRTSDDHAEATRKRAEVFKQEQADIDRRLKAITKSDASDDAARRFETSMEKLRRLEISRGYVALLKDADKLRYSRAPCCEIAG